MSRICISSLLRRQMHTNAEIVQNCKEIRNRNPRNLERLRIARKPIGYVLDTCHQSYWHKLVVSCSQRYVLAEIVHCENGPVIAASTREWGMKKQLRSTNNETSFKFVGRVLAQRCLECGISEIFVNNSEIVGSKVQVLVNELTNNGISITEPSTYKHPTSTFRYRPEKPWESYE